jgi:hypothetical protein
VGASAAQYEEHDRYRRIGFRGDAALADAGMADTVKVVGDGVDGLVLVNTGTLDGSDGRAQLADADPVTASAGYGDAALLSGAIAGLWSRATCRPDVDDSSVWRG